MCLFLFKVINFKCITKWCWGRDFFFLTLCSGALSGHNIETLRPAYRLPSADYIESHSIHTVHQFERHLQHLAAAARPGFPRSVVNKAMSNRNAPWMA